MNTSEKNQENENSPINPLNEEMLEQYKMFSSISDGSTDAIYVKDVHGRYLLFNKEAARVVGKNPSEVLGKDDYNIFPDHEARAIMAGDKKVMQSRLSSTYEEVVTTAFGTVTFLSTKGPTFDSAGKVSGLFGIARDITDRKQAESALRKSEVKYRQLVESVNHSENLNFRKC